MTSGAVLLNDPAWSVSHVMDLDGDGKADLLLKHTNGGIYAWTMNGLSVMAGGLVTGPGTLTLTPPQQH